MDEKKDFKQNISQETLHNELAERRRALSEIRSTVYKFVAAVSAAGITLFWLLLTECDLSLAQTIALSIFVIAMAGFVHLFLNSLQKGFQKNREIMINLETRLGLHDGSLLPEEYKSAKKKSSDFIPMAKIFILFVSIAIVVVSWVQCAIPLCEMRKDSVVQQKLPPNSPGLDFSVKAKEAKDFSINIKYNNGGAD
jgi:hypothetical protein